MKKLFLTVCVCVCGFAAMAQSPINIGIHGGTSSNRINFKDLTSAISSRSGQGYMLGAFVRVNLGALYLEPSLNFSHKKSIAEGIQPAAGEDRPTITLKNNTFNIPVMVGLNLLDLSIAKIRVFVGPQYSVGKLKNLKYLGNEIKQHKSNWSGKAGVGVDIWKLTFDVDYEKGFNKIAHELKAPRSFNFTLGLKIL